MVTEGLNININDIEDDDLREKVIKYFKNFKKGKLDDKDLDELDDEEEDEKEDEKEDESADIDKIKKMSSEEIEDLIKSLDNETKKELIKDLKDEFDEADDDEKKEIQKLIKIAKGNVSESMINEVISIVGAVLATTVAAKLVHAKKKHDVRKTSSRLQELAEYSKSEEDREKYKKQLELYNKVAYDSNATPITNKKQLKKRISNLKKRGDLGESFSPNDLKDIKEQTKKAYKSFNKKEKDSEKDEEGNVIKQEEITNKEGKKVKVTTHTGPRGGKFYYPDGAPKDAEHKVYIDKHGKVKECVNLIDYLYESFKN